ncbi:hypothetical protein [Massilia soli]|uniref:DUF4189 domain-containing protein n=1 Tax=Massilia soli TaxID=2792854 RepID=A0ABS7SHZ8_9BURK|nr:hypothetical protein [Massilia soli]MBZ2205739.1 hypothetical protein [Massilia soli]
MKTLTSRHVTRLSALVLLLALGACSGVSANGNAPAAPGAPGAPPAAATPTPPPAPAPAPAPGGQAAAAGLLQKIQEQIGTAECDNASQCKTLPVGHKSCGGPEGYLAYSTKSGNTKQLMALAEQYAAARKAENERSGMLSNCMMEPDPGATCVANRCVLVKRGVSAQ